MQKAETELPKENRLERELSRLLLKEEKALAAYLMGGDPDLKASRELCRSALDGGVDILEIGIPFSDPLADGPAIQKAAQRSLKNGTNVYDIMEMVEDLRRYADVPVLLMTYYNTVYKMGAERFFSCAERSGADGVIVPDLPYEEQSAVKKHAHDNNQVIIDFLAPTTPGERIAKIVHGSRGFLYCVSLTGVTGVRESLSGQLDGLAVLARKYTALPLLAGFGISTPQQAVEAARHTDGVIVGSALVREVERNNDDSGAMAEAIKSTVRSFKSALKGRPLSP